ncbi:MAG TPA: hypothetical protein VMZ00_01945 [Sporichthya sp.]|nr:hypothetical protein [Sporichthya sp.]
MASGSSAGGVRPTGGVTPEALVPMRRLAYAALPPSLSRRRRARLADALAHQALLQGASQATARAHLIREVLHAGRIGGWVPGQLARLGESSTSAGRALEDALGAMVPASRAAFALMHLEDLTPAQAIAVLDLAGVQDAASAVTFAERSTLDPAALRSLVVRVPTTAISPRLAAGAAAALVLAIAAPVIAVNAFSGNDSAPAAVAAQSSFGSEREAAVSTAKVALRDARNRAATAEASADAERRLKRSLHRLDAAIHQKGVSRKQLRRLKELRSDLREELQDIQSVRSAD